MSPFLTELHEKLVDPHANDGSGLWQLTEELRVYCKRLKKTIVLPVGFVHDHASVPRFPVVYALYGNRYHRPAAVHDFLCRMRLCRRETADLVFLDLMRAQNADEIAEMKERGIDDDEIAEHKATLESRAWAMYVAVAALTKTGLWKKDVGQPGFEPVA